MIDPQGDWNIQILARTIYGMARGEIPEAREAFAALILNRISAQHSHDTGARWGRTIAEVCLRADQFSCWNDDDDNRRVIVAVNPGVLAFMDCLTLALRASYGMITDASEGADHCHVHGTTPPWLETVTFTLRIGNLRFYRELSQQAEADLIAGHPLST